MNKLKSVYEKVGSMHGVSAREVKKEIQAAIDIAVNSQELQAQQFWRNYKSAGYNPAPDELIVFLKDYFLTNRFG